MQINYQSILMYTSILVGVFLLFAPKNFFQQYAPTYVTTVDNNLLLIAGGSCLALAYYLYSQRTLEFPLMRGGSRGVSYQSPEYDYSVDSKYTF